MTEVNVNGIDFTDFTKGLEAKRALWASDWSGNFNIEFSDEKGNLKVLKLPREVLNVLKEIVAEDFPKCPEMKDNHFKGYLYDSLVYRYQLAREEMCEHEISLDEKESHKYSHMKHRDRDIMRFIQILDEAMGEHD